MNQDRYCTTWIDKKGEWQSITSKTKKEALAWYDMVEASAKFKVMYDIVSGNEIVREEK